LGFISFTTLPAIIFFHIGETGNSIEIFYFRINEVILLAHLADCVQRRFINPVCIVLIVLFT